MAINQRANLNEKRLITLFNKRNDEGFSAVYSLLFSELSLYAKRLMAPLGEDGTDIVHDIFISILDRKSIQFDSLTALKSYLYTSISNRHKKAISKNSSHSKYFESIRNSEEHYISNMIESEFLGLVAAAEKVLPEECALIFKLFLEGYEMKDIVKQVGKSKSYVYAKKQQAIDIIKKQLPKLYLFIC